MVSLAFTLGRLGIIVNSNLVAAMLEPYCDGVFGIITGAIIGKFERKIFFQIVM